MASSLRMMMIGISWIVTMIILAFLTYLGAVFQKTINNFLMTWDINPIFQSDVGLSWWIPPLYYIVIILIAIAITYRCYQEVVVITDYFPDQGFLR